MMAHGSVVLYIYRNIEIILYVSCASTYTLPGRKYSSTTKYPCTDSAMYRLNIQLGPKMGLETCRSQMFVVLALT